MELAVLGTESLGVRGLCCLIRAGGRCILVDPGVALGYTRNGLHPHPCQVAVGDAVRDRIISAFSEATDIVFSHYHGDHIPLADANPYQLPLGRVPPVKAGLWFRGTSELSPRSLKRREDLVVYMDGDTANPEGREGPVLTFSNPVPHGPPGSHLGSVMMTRVTGDDYSFVHASDIQLLNREAVDVIARWEPDIAIASGPPLYLNRISTEERKYAREYAIELAGSIGLLILDHHLLRSVEGFLWLEKVSAEAGGNIISAADFMSRRTGILEAKREEMYEKIPVPEGWHEAYAGGKTDYFDYVDSGLSGDLQEIRSYETIDIRKFL